MSNHCGQQCHGLLRSNDWISKQPSLSATWCRSQIHKNPCTNTTRTEIPLKTQIWHLHQLQHQHSWHTLVWNGSRHQQREQQMGNWHRQHVKCVHRAITWLDNQCPQPNPHSKTRPQSFINDVNLFIGKLSTSTEEEFIAAAQEDIDNWHGILRATGGELNTKKGFWSNFDLQFDTQGTPSLCDHQPQDPKLYLTQTNGTKTELCHTQSTEGIRHLGF